MGIKNRVALALCLILLKVDKHRELAKTNPDFDILRQDDRFKKLIEG